MKLIVAMDASGLIGKGDALPWHVPEDLAYFKRMTKGNSVLMGRKTFESIGRLLPGRENIVLTRDEAYAFEGLRVENDLESLKDFEGFLIGGSELYRECIEREYVDELFITRIPGTYEGDVYFPYTISELVAMGYELHPYSEISVLGDGKLCIFEKYEKRR